MPATAKPVMPSKVLKSARHVSDLLALWALCENRTCRKLGQCRAVPPRCWSECMELAPDAASEFVFTLLEGKEENLSFEDALADVPEELVAEWSAWHEAVTRITGRPSMKPRRGEARAVGADARATPE